MSSQYTVSPTRSSIGLTSQQKDLLIIHLKGEVYELKQAESDYRSLMEQVHQLENRLKYLADEREYALKDYESKINGQDKSINLGQRELDELKRLIANKDEENNDTKGRLMGSRDKTKHTENDYQQLRELNDEIMRKNRFIKEDVADIMDKLEQEKDKRVDIKGAKDKVQHQLYRAVDDIEQLKVKDDGLIRSLEQRAQDQRQKEGQLRGLERQDQDITPKLDRVKGQIQDLQYQVNQVQNDMEIQQKEVDRCANDSNKWTFALQNEEVKQQEHRARIAELQEKMARRDNEHEQMQMDIQGIHYDSERQKEQYDSLLKERQALIECSQRLMSANHEIEGELDSFVKVDDSICHTLEKRDENLSPKVKSSQFSMLKMQQQLAAGPTQPPVYQNRFDVSHTDNMNIHSYNPTHALRDPRLIQSTTSESFYVQNQTRDVQGLHFQYNPAQNPMSLSQQTNQPLRFLNPRTLKEGHGSQTSLNQLGEQKEFKTGHSPLRYKY